MQFLSRNVLFSASFFSLLLLPFEGSAQDITVMSFNIRYGTAKDGANHWSLRKEFVVDTIKATSPDLLGTQENLDFQASYLADNLKGYSRFGMGREKGGKGERCEIYWKTNRFKLLAKGNFMLSPTPELHGSKGWDAALPRIATWVKLRDAKSKQAVLFVNTHFDHRGRQARTESAKLIRTQAKKLADSMPIVVCGDFNIPPSSEGIKHLSAAPWIDTYRSAFPVEQAGEGTFSAFKGERSRHRIDYIFTKGMEVVAANIDRSIREGKNPSDHFPVNAILDWMPIEE